MSEQPDRIENLLRNAMRAHVEDAYPGLGLARRALRGTARGRRAQYAATAAASVAAVGVVTAATVAVHQASRGGRDSAALGGGVPSPSASCYDTASPTAGTPTPTGSAAIASSDQLVNQPAQPDSSQQIRAVSLADPAPGYPLRRGADSVTPTGFGPSSTYWTATFLLAQTPGAQRTMGDGAVETDPTGPEATVLVIDGHPFNLDHPTAIEGVPVSETTTVLGHEAWVTSACDQTDIVFSTGRFQVLLAGFPGGDDAARDMNVARLQAVAGALQGLR